MRDREMSNKRQVRRLDIPVVVARGNRTPKLHPILLPLGVVLWSPSSRPFQSTRNLEMTCGDENSSTEQKVRDLYYERGKEKPGPFPFS